MTTKEEIEKEIENKSKSGLLLKGRDRYFYDLGKNEFLTSFAEKIKEIIDECSVVTNPDGTWINRRQLKQEIDKLLEKDLK